MLKKSKYNILGLCASLQVKKHVYYKAKWTEHALRAMRPRTDCMHPGRNVIPKWT